jgi:hypothetical protein
MMNKKVQNINKERRERWVIRGARREGAGEKNDEAVHRPFNIWATPQYEVQRK